MLDTVLLLQMMMMLDVGLPASQASLDTVFLSVLLMHGDCRTVCLEDVRVDLANTGVSGWHGRFLWWW